MAKKGRLFIISGPSGAGKSTVIKAILGKNRDLRYSISCTTRPPRGNEQDGVDYYFITKAAFEKKIDAGQLAEWAEVHGHLYGTSATYIDETLTDGQDVLLDIDVEGAKKLFVKYPEAVSIFIAPPTMRKLEERLAERDTDSPEAVERRLKNAEAEMAQAHRYDHILVNEELTQTVSRLETIIGKACFNG
ncbi:MAG: guanylate kinase [Proteobacteria bacterium]|nr:guanylate kinase [Pseudomonadota bacterium]